jgi:FkbM family methyltransferase
MIELVVVSDYASMPQLASTLERFARAGSLSWLSGGVPMPATCHPQAPAMDSLNDLPAGDRLVLLVAPNSEALPDSGHDRRVLRVLERSASAGCDPATTLIIDDYAQLELLADLSGYPNLIRLVGSHGKTAADYRADVLTRYAAAFDALRAQRRAVVFGAQRLGEAVAESLQSAGYSVTAFVDNGTSKHGSRIRDVVVQPLSALDDKTLPVVIATTRFTSSITRQLKGEGFRHILPYAVMSLVDPERYPDEIPYIGIPQDFAKHVAQYLGLFIALSDEKSRRVLDGLIGYRLDYDAQQADSVADEFARQYFDQQLIAYNGQDVFVDLGGYDGDTAEKFIAYSDGTYAKVFVFEPDTNLLQRAAKRLAPYQNVELVPAGAYSRDGELRFAASGRTNGSICEAGEIVIPVRSLDSAFAFAQAPTLIKMDIEGAETEALRGAAHLLRSAKPRLAIAAYHYAQDLWRLVDVVREINPSYRFYLRHYSETGLESVIYAV